MEYNGLMRMIRIIFWVALGIVVVGGVFLMLPRFIFPLYALFSPRTPKPEITYGEFPFRIEYELDGQIHVIEDIVIAEFGGLEFSASSMRRERTWRSTLANNGENNFKQIQPGIYFDPGFAGYYMGELGCESITYRPHIFLRDVDTRLIHSRYEVNEAQEVLEEHGITLISWEISDPIINNFGVRNNYDK